MGKIIWFTGLSGSGKTTLAQEVRARMEHLGKRVKIIDGDEVRKTHTRHLGFSREDLRENNRVMAELAVQEAKKYDYVLVPKISPRAEDRQTAREILGANFIELFTDAPLGVCMERDPKGLYRRAQDGELKDMIGVSPSSPYEPPLDPDIRVRTDINSIDKCADLVLQRLLKPKHLIFLHIGRSGGSTLRNIIERQFEPGRVLRIMSKGHDATFEQIERHSPEEREKIKFISGHLPFGAHEFFRSPSEYMTLIRDPVERVISEYNSVKHKPRHEFYEAANQMSLREYALSGVSAAHNNQTRILSGTYRPGQTFSRAPLLGGDALEKARENLREHFRIAGLMERFDETVMVAAKEFGWKNCYYVRRQVSKFSPQGDGVDEETRAIIAGQNKLDRELHKYAASLLEEKIKNYGPSFEKDLAHFRKTNNYLRPILTLRQRAENLPLPVKKFIRVFVRRGGIF
ncbi:MAG: adenylyl-sulfate kinase [Candidatus Sungbacteria bacterium]|nr:adenylyl-sulfate kinase [Candidatus Sungbacteria bacterium]